MPRTSAEPVRELVGGQVTARVGAQVHERVRWQVRERVEWQVDDIDDPVCEQVRADLLALGFADPVALSGLGRVL